MYIRAIEEADKFTKPIHIISRGYGSNEVVPGSATFFFVNSDGWGITCKHVAENFIAGEKLGKKWPQFLEDLKKVEQKKKKKKAITELEKSYGLKKGATIQLRNRLMNCVDGFKGLEFRIHGDKDIDLALVKVECDKLLVTEFAKFPKDTSSLKQGKFLCRLGYPFPEFTNFTYNPNSDEIEWTNTGTRSSPKFPIEGMVTRHLGRQGPNGIEVYGFEMSTPGLRGQSGGPAFDSDGIVWGIQSSTRHLYLGFDIKHQIRDAGKDRIIKDSAFLNVGWCIHVDKIKELLVKHKVRFEEI
jgi:hypothetical protein